MNFVSADQRTNAFETAALERLRSRQEGELAAAMELVEILIMKPPDKRDSWWYHLSDGISYEEFRLVVTDAILSITGGEKPFACPNVAAGSVAFGCIGFDAVTVSIENPLPSSRFLLSAVIRAALGYGAFPHLHLLGERGEWEQLYACFEGATPEEKQANLMGEFFR